MTKPPARRISGAALLAATLAACTRPTASSVDGGDAPGTGGRDAATRAGLIDARIRDASIAAAADADVTPAAAPVPDPFANVSDPPPPPPVRGGVDFDAIPAVLETLPPAHLFDGDVSEWLDALGAPLPAANGRGKVWFALTAAGLHVAGDLDARVAATPLDHVRVFLAFTPPRLPDLAFFGGGVEGWRTVDAAWCKNTQPEGSGGVTEKDVPTCLEWVARSRQVRSGFAARAWRVIDVDLMGKRVSGVEGARLAVQRGDAGVGATFELEVPASALPETAEMSLRTVHVAARAESDRLAKGAKGAAPRWNVFVRTLPLALHAAPAIVAQMAKLSNETSASSVGMTYVPAATATRVAYFFNRRNSGPYDPWSTSILSPQVTEIDVAKGRKIFTLRACERDAGSPCAVGGDIEIRAHQVGFDVPRGPEHPMIALASYQDGHLRDLTAATSFDPDILVLRPPGVHILEVNHGPSDAYGQGASGGEPAYQFDVVKMNDRGAFSLEDFPLASRRSMLLGTEGLAGFENFAVCSPERPWIDPNLVFFGLRGECNVEASPDGGEDWEARARLFEARYRWNASEERYVLSGRVTEKAKRDGGSRGGPNRGDP